MLTNDDNYISNNPVSITPSGFFGSSKSNIVEFEGFLSQEELETLNNFIRNNTTWDVTETHYNENGTVIYDSNYWEDRVITYPNLMKVNPDIINILERLVARFKPKVDSFFQVDASPTICIHTEQCQYIVELSIL